MTDQQNWRTEVNAPDYFGHQKKQAAIENRRPVIRKASDLVGPGINANAVRITDFNDTLATYDGFFAADLGALNPPNNVEAFIGTVSSDAGLGGIQSFTGLTSGTYYQRVFVRNPSDAATIYWGEWGVVGTSATGGGFLETLPVSIIDAKGDMIVGVSDNVAMRQPVGADKTSLVADSTAPGGVTWANRVQKVQQGDGISVDNTDPLNPIVSALASAGTDFVNTDTATATGTGNIVITLTRVPKPGSEQVFVGGLPIPATAWTRTDYQLTIPGHAWFYSGMQAWVDYSTTTEDRLGPVITPIGSTVDPANPISGTAAPGRPLQVWIDGVSIGSITVPLSGAWSITPPAQTYTTHTITATQTEPDGVLLEATPVTYTVAIVPLTSLTLRGFTTTGALPAGTAVGDFLVVVSRGRDYSGDSRLTLVSTNPPMETKTWIGNATSLGALSFTGSGVVRVASFVGTAHLLNSSYANGTFGGGSPSAASVAGSAAILALGERSSFVSGTWNPPSPWVPVDTSIVPPFSDGGVHSGAVDIFYWSNAAASVTPAGTINAGGGVDQSDVVVVSLKE